MTITLRPAADVDGAFVERTYFTTQRWIIEALFGWRGEERERANFLATYDAPNTHVVLVDGVKAGWITVVRGERIVVDGLYLIPAMQRKGVGTELLRRILAEAAARNVPVEISTAKINPARELYARLGFAVDREDVYKVYMTAR